MEEKKKRGRPAGPRFKINITEESVGARMIRAAQQKHMAPMTPEQEAEYKLMVQHGLAFMAHLGKLILLVSDPGDNYQI